MMAFATVQRLLSVSVLVCGCCLMTARAAGAATAPSAASGALLLSSEAIQQQVDAGNRARVMHLLAAVHAGPAAGVISSRQLQNLLGEDLAESPQQRTCTLDELEIECTLDELEIEVRAPRGVPERPLQAQIPLGLAGLAWGLRHPAQAWRLFLPVLPTVM